MMLLFYCPAECTHTHVGAPLYSAGRRGGGHIGNKRVCLLPGVATFLSLAVVFVPRLYFLPLKLSLAIMLDAGEQNLSV